LKHQVFPVDLVNGTIVIATANPFDMHGPDEIQLIAGKPVRIVLSGAHQIEQALQRFYQQNAGAVASAIHDISEVGLNMLEGGLEDEIRDLAAIESIANEAPIIRLVNALLLQSVRDGASDIHFEPFENEARVRYRIDGILYDVSQPPKKLYPAIISRVKLMAGMDIAEKRIPQDGRIRIRISGQDLDLRAAVAPCVHGESAVLRILNRASMFLELSSLGISPDILERFSMLFQKPNGAILVTGPTGSGKTTTLYAVLAKLNSSEKKIFTVEDPVEYQLNGINQMQVNSKVNFTFANGLRSIVRHDPDIILVGEIRDSETAEIAVQAALTGHLVFSTLHTNDAAGAITRLLDMGVEEFLVASTVRGVLAQRLVRVICSNCKEPYNPPPEQLQRLGLRPGEDRFWHGAGCDLCKGIGYRGQTGIYELLPVDGVIEELVLKRASATQIREAAIKGGMVPLRQDGLAKAKAGITTLAEVLRVSQE
jgi:general secretion pathway protein E